MSCFQIYHPVDCSDNDILPIQMCERLKNNVCENTWLSTKLYDQINELFAYSLEQFESICNLTKPLPFNELEPDKPSPFSLSPPYQSRQSISDEIVNYIAIAILALISMALIYSLFKYIRNDKKYQLSNRLSVEELDQVFDLCSRLNIANINSKTTTNVDDILVKLETEYEKAEKRYLLLSATLEKNKGSILYGFFKKQDTARDISRKIFEFADIMPKLKK